MRLAFGRLGSILVVAAGWILFAVRTMLDLIGYSTAPEDFEVAKTRLGEGFSVLLQAPWWAFFVFAMLATMWLMWVSWPQHRYAIVAPDSAPRPQEKPTVDYEMLAQQMSSLSSGIRVHLFNHRSGSWKTNNSLIGEIHALALNMHRVGISFLPEKPPGMPERAWLDAVEAFVSRIEPLIRTGHLADAAAIAKKAAAGFSDDVEAGRH